MMTPSRVWTLSAISALAGILLEGIVANFVVHRSEAVIDVVVILEELFAAGIAVLLTATLVTLGFISMRR